MKKTLLISGFEKKMNITTLFKSIPVFACFTIFFLSHPSVVKASPLSPSNHTKQISDKAMPTHETNGICYQFGGCKQSGENLSCAVLLTSLTQDYGMHVSQISARIIDLGGNQYSPSYFQFGDYGKTFHSTYLNLVEGVPLKIVIHFQGVGTKMNGASLIQFGDGRLKNLSF
ncbi:hypothetical protein [Crocosphaera chwakensis]|uniref:Uncharacterized protein n=1 Tax=Crocosphaera chwakensis CCY0110 TaxID=391612 RepID=A3ILW3_9CHRO|nr:hypothetical protein [Crocosphaera chwakensis]EAZ92419.1 hypothetical protein CY0110_01799 [Crocosphaera chwakensis CCY0110]